MLKTTQITGSWSGAYWRQMVNGVDDAESGAEALTYLEHQFSEPYTNGYQHA